MKKSQEQRQREWADKSWEIYGTLLAWLNGPQLFPFILITGDLGISKRHVKRFAYTTRLPARIRQLILQQ